MDFFSIKKSGNTEKAAKTHTYTLHLSKDKDNCLDVRMSKL